jgi:Reverse transcriptase (RNA-dependent DNA polymerase)
VVHTYKPERTQTRIRHPFTRVQLPETQYEEVNVPPQVPLQVDEPTEEGNIVSVEPVTTRTGRVVRPPARLQDYVVYSTVSNIHTVEPDTEYKHPVYYDHPMEETIAYAASSDPDTLYLHEAMKGTDKAQFLQAMEEEVKAQSLNGNWEVVAKDSLPPGTRVLPAVWAMKRKRRILDGTVYKWKARLNIDGGKQIKGLDYWETYAPVASWSTIRLVLMMAIRHGWALRQLDFVQAYPQAPIEQEMYMEVPKGFHVLGSRDNHVLKILKNIYGQKQAGRVWNEYLTKGLIDIGFTQSKNDMCLLWRGTCIIVVYTDDTIVTGPVPEEVEATIELIGKAFDITHSITVSDFLGVNIAIDHEKGTITFTQPHLIESILRDLGLQAESKTKLTPAVSNVVLHAHEESQDHCEEWNYRSVIGKLNYLEKSSRPDIAFAVHQCARYTLQPKVEHTAAVKLIGRYLLNTKDKGIVCLPDATSIHCYADASFAGEWHKTIAEHDPNTARSRTGFILLYAGCPIIWCSKLQTEIALSATEAEYVALSQSLREVMSIFAILQEIKAIHPIINHAIPTVHCTAFDDNVGAIEMARCPKMRPRTKHLNIKYHHFRQAVAEGKIKIQYVRSHLQLADILTKALGISLFIALRSIIMGWWASTDHVVQRECDNARIRRKRLKAEEDIEEKRIDKRTKRCSTAQGNHSHPDDNNNNNDIDNDIGLK